MSQYPNDYVRHAEARWKALIDYTPAPLDGRITLFRAQKQPLFQLDPSLGWASLAHDSVDVHVIPGTYEDMLEEPNLQILAAELRKIPMTAQGHSSKRREGFLAG